VLHLLWECRSGREGGPSSETGCSVLTRGRGIVDGLLAALLSSPCVACGRIADHPTRGAVCDDCWRAVRVITPPVCHVCGEPLPSGRFALPDAQPLEATGGVVARCAACTARRPRIAIARAVGPYEGTLRDLLHALKYDGRRSIAPRLGALLRERCGTVLDRADAVVPVPLHPRREWTRGFNQAEAIARELGVPVWRPLRRRRHTSAQSTLPASERWRNVAGAFDLRRRFRRRGRPSALAGARVVLVDDVRTTGATLDACAEVLERAGVSEVRAVTVARAVLGHPARPALPRDR
jgi:ComF family protein